MQTKLRITIEGKTLFDQGYRGNGCGSGFVSWTLCFIAQKFLKVDIKEVWVIHDCEYNVSRSLKSTSHKIEADSNAFKNIHKCLSIPKEKREWTFRDAFAKIIYASLVVGGDSAYWETSIKVRLKHVLIIAAIYTIWSMLWKL